jgi:ABC-type Fe3+/spermidine/putrescine transport system ATPase subunit
VREELKRLQRELGITFIHVTHSQDEAMALADLMVVMEDGHIRQAGRRGRCSSGRSAPFIAALHRRATTCWRRQSSSVSSAMIMVRASALVAVPAAFDSW